MKNYIVNEFIAAMKERIPRGINLANFLTDALCMGKEAVYRRIEGERNYVRSGIYLRADIIFYVVEYAQIAFYNLIITFQRIG